MTGAPMDNMWLALLDSIWLPLLLLTIALLVIATVVELARGRRLRVWNQAYEAELRALKAELAALCTANIGVGKQVGQMEQQVRRLAERQDLLELREASNRPYTQAIRLVRNGADVKDLMSTCALTQGEAELLVMLHGSKDAE